MTDRFRAALDALGATADVLDDEARHSLDVRGYAIGEGRLAAASTAAMRARLDELLDHVERHGSLVPGDRGTQVVGRLLERDAMFLPLVTDPWMLAAAWHVTRARFSVRSPGLRTALPGQGLQAIHADVASRPGTTGPYLGAQVAWAIGDVTAANGATRFVVGSHRSDTIPADTVANPYLPVDGEIALEAPAGSVIVFNVHAWHRAGTNLGFGRRYATFAPCFVTSAEAPPGAGRPSPFGWAVDEVLGHAYAAPVEVAAAHTCWCSGKPYPDGAVLAAPGTARGHAPESHTPLKKGSTSVGQVPRRWRAPPST